MVKHRREKEDDYIGPAKGWSKFFHRLFLLVTFPLRKPIKFVALLFVLTILYIAPTFFGVKPADLNSWHFSHLKKSASEVSKKAADMASESVLTNTITTKASTKLEVVDVPAKTSGRKVFERAKSAPVVVEKNVLPEDSRVEASSVAIDSVKQELKGEPIKNLDLSYLSQPRIISGKAVVINANELNVNGVDMFLYGIYVAPGSEKGMKALKYLQNLINESSVSCEVIAYTKQNIATSICKIENININKELVEKGYSKNVALN